MKERNWQADRGQRAGKWLTVWTLDTTFIALCGCAIGAAAYHATSTKPLNDNSNNNNKR